MRVDEIKKIYENKVIPFENTDDSYKSKMSAYYSEWSSMGDKFSDAGNAIRDFLAGIGDSLVDTVKGLLTLVVDLGILYVDVRWKSIVPIQVPEVLDQEVEKIKQKYEPLLKDPVNTIGGIGQSICDTADEKGVAYSSGYIVTEVVTLNNVKVQEISYVKRNSTELKTLRDEFNKTTRKAFLKDLGNNVEYLKNAGFSETDILKIQNGRVPDGWQVHHKLPLDDSGTNSFDNLVLIQNEPYHKVITNYQNSIARQMEIGEVQVVQWPMPNGNIYPAQH